jgi:transcription elongation GreA/GreB family factor
MDRIVTAAVVRGLDPAGFFMQRAFDRYGRTRISSIVQPAPQSWDEKEAEAGLAALSIWLTLIGDHTSRQRVRRERSSGLSVAFTKEESAETASETQLPDRPISPHPNLVTEAGLQALELQLQQARDAYDAAQQIEDVNERRRQAAVPLRDMRYFSARVRTAQVVASPASNDTVAFGSTVTFSREDGRVQTYRIVGEDEADPKAGSISFVSPVARSMMGKAVGDVVGSGNQEIEIVAIS